ncbi:threonine--tRNA ligase [Candidatus Bathyarchaeota archaeon]|nr:threonine--tRNA ligase [Candidatus Bathyarchaeota archaeon]NIW16792.1 threonine--tRNA ligase [Candidatus Bathyarchaeota archaeon]NIW34781.1 threonine--tRNA ligase [Candidatus Bathyarchaeota archaeon]
MKKILKTKHCSRISSSYRQEPSTEPSLEGGKQDHGTLGKQLDLFSIDRKTGVGLVLWHPKGTLVRKILRDFLEKEHLRHGYKLVSTPHIARGELWEASGHLEFYRENMYVFERKGEPYVVKPMNCPLHIQIYKSRTRSYRDLPIRYAELGTVYRRERSGTLHGLLRVRGFTQDDAHIFCTPRQVEDEITEILDLTEHILGRLGFSEYKVELSVKDPKQPENYIGSNEDWESAQEILAKALERRRMTYRKAVGEAVFYGPKIDLKIVDSIGREWQCSTIQFDFNLPKRFDLTFVGSDGQEHPTLMIHRTLLGSIERFIGIMMEHYAGNLPLWLPPIQVRVMSISKEYNHYAEKIHKALIKQGIRSTLDNSASTLSYKIREAETQKVPYMVICGEAEVKSDELSVRRHTVGDVGRFTFKSFVRLIEEENHRKR